MTASAGRPPTSSTPAVPTNGQVAGPSPGSRCPDELAQHCGAIAAPVQQRPHPPGGQPGLVQQRRVGVRPAGHPLGAPPPSDTAGPGWSAPCYRPNRRPPRRPPRRRERRVRGPQRGQRLPASSPPDCRRCVLSSRSHPLAPAACQSPPDDVARGGGSQPPPPVAGPGYRSGMLLRVRRSSAGWGITEGGRVDRWSARWSTRSSTCTARRPTHWSAGWRSARRRCSSGSCCPVETAVILGGVLAHRGSVSLPGIAAVAVVGAIAGDSVATRSAGTTAPGCSPAASSPDDSTGCSGPGGAAGQGRPGGAPGSPPSCAR